MGDNKQQFTKHGTNKNIIFLLKNFIENIVFFNFPNKQNINKILILKKSRQWKATKYSQNCVLKKSYLLQNFKL